VSTGIDPRDAGEFVDEICSRVTQWPCVTDADHRFGGREFHLATREFGHVHQSGLLDIDFRRTVRDALVATGATEPHHIFPESGWTSFRITESDDVDHAVDLLRLSYLTTALTLSHTHTGRRVIEELDVESEIRDLPPAVRAAVESHYTDHF
jgi:hypothetical protein